MTPIDTLLDRAATATEKVQSSANACSAFLQDAFPLDRPHLSIQAQANANTWKEPDHQQIRSNFKPEQASAHTHLEWSALTIQLEEHLNTLQNILSETTGLLQPQVQSWFRPNSLLACSLYGEWTNQGGSLQVAYTACLTEDITSPLLSPIRITSLPFSLRYIPLASPAFRALTQSLNTLPQHSPDAEKWEVGITRNSRSESFVFPAKTQEDAERVAASLVFNPLFLPRTKGWVRHFYIGSTMPVRKKNLLPPTD